MGCVKGSVSIIARREGRDCAPTLSAILRQSLASLAATDGRPRQARRMAVRFERDRTGFLCYEFAKRHLEVSVGERGEDGRDRRLSSTYFASRTVAG